MYDPRIHRVSEATNHVPQPKGTRHSGSNSGQLLGAGGSLFIECYGKDHYNFQGYSALHWCIMVFCSFKPGSMFLSTRKSLAGPTSDVDEHSTFAYVYRASKSYCCINVLEYVYS